MQELFKLNNKIIPNLNTSVLCTSDFNSQNDIAFYLKQNIPIITKQEQTSKSPINPELLNELDCLYLTSKTNLTKIDKLKLNIISKLSQEPSCLIFFNILTYLDTIFKEKLLTFLKNHHIHLINYTSEIEETLFFDYLIVTNNKEIIMEGPTKDILKEETILKKLGFNLPFIIELSNGLKYYGLVNETYYNNERLLNELWK